MLLEVKGLTKFFGGLTAVNNLSYNVEEGEIVSLIGPNGSGKTTTFNLLCGVFKPSGGQVIFKEENVTGLKPHQIAEKGIIRTFQNENLFEQMTVMENLILSCHLSNKLSFWSTILRNTKYKKEKQVSDDNCIKLLELVGLLSARDEVVKNIPHGHKRALGLAMAIAANPKLLLLDEPVTGMNTEETINMVNLIRKVNDTGVTILLVEHDMKVVMGVSDRVIVISYGEKIAEGKPQEVKNNKTVIEAYLGKDYVV